MTGAGGGGGGGGGWAGGGQGGGGRNASIDGAATTLAGSAFHDIMVLGRKE